jgi:hypothetical protein
LLLIARREYRCAIAKIHKAESRAIRFEVIALARGRAGIAMAVQRPAHGFQGVDESAGIRESFQSLAEVRRVRFFYIGNARNPCGVGISGSSPMLSR